MALNTQFPNWANGANSSLVMTGPYVLTGPFVGLPRYQLPQQLIETGFGAALVSEGSTTESPTYPEGQYNPDPFIEGAGVITGDAKVGETLTFTPGVVSGTAPINLDYLWVWVQGKTITYLDAGLTYVVDSLDVDKLIGVFTVAENSKGEVRTVSNLVGPVLGTDPAKGVTGTISVVGGGAVTAFAGQTLEISTLPTATGTPAPAISWNWVRNPTLLTEVPIQVSGYTYVIQGKDIGCNLALKVTATNSSGSVSWYTNEIAVQTAAPTVVVAPKIDFTDPEVGDFIGSTTGIYSGYPTPQITNWGWARVAVPNPIPFQAGARLNSYRVTRDDVGQQLVYFQTVTNSVGTATFYSNPTGIIPLPLEVVERSQLIPPDGTPSIGDVLRGIPAVFNQVPTSLTYQWGYPTTFNAFTPIPGALGLNYTVQPNDVAKNIVFVTTATAQYPVSQVRSISNSWGPIRQLIALVAPPSLSYVGSGPRVGEVCTIYPINTNPTNNLQPPFTGSAIVQDMKVYRVDPQLNRVLIKGVVTPSPSDLSVTIPESAFGQQIVVEMTASYNDGIAISTVSAQFVSPAVIATPPSVVTAGSVAGKYTPGNTLTYTPATFSGDPTPTVSWVWQTPKGGVIQQGGTTLQLTDDMIGLEIGVAATAKNVAGVVVSVTAYKKVVTGGFVINHSGIITGPTIIGDGITLTYTSPDYDYPSDPDGRDLITWDWYVEYPDGTDEKIQEGDTTLNVFNENGRWTDSSIYVLCTLTHIKDKVTYVDTSNVLGPMVGTPHIANQGKLSVTSDTAGGKFLKLTPPVFASSVDPIIYSDYNVGVEGTPIGFAKPRTQVKLTSICSNRDAGGEAVARNSQGVTYLTLGPINVGPVV